MAYYYKSKVKVKYPTNKGIFLVKILRKENYFSTTNSLSVWLSITYNNNNQIYFSIETKEKAPKTKVLRALRKYDFVF